MNPARFHAGTIIAIDTLPLLWDAHHAVAR
jgi:hypothetical protein